MTQQSTPRKANIELLRIVCMLGITTLHYLYGTDAILLTTNAVTPLRVTGSVIESLCIPSVACYVLISGYCDRNTQFRPGRILRLIAQVWFWSVLLHLLCAAVGLVPLCTGIWDLAIYVLPVMSGHYWFASAFVVLELLAPLLNAAAEHVSRRSLKGVIAALLLYESVIKTVVPFQLNMDEMGYDYGFFILIFLIGVWLRKYGAPRILCARETVPGVREREAERIAHGGRVLSGHHGGCHSDADTEAAAAGGRDQTKDTAKGKEALPVSKVRALTGYLVSCGAIAAVQIAASLIHARTGSLSWLMSAPFHYNYLFAVTGSVCIFLLFAQWEMGAGTALPLRIIRKFAPLTFGVYLIQCHSDLLPEWPGWLAGAAGMSADTAGVAAFFLWMAASVVIVYAVCSAMDAVRKLLFDRVRRVRHDPHAGRQ